MNGMWIITTRFAACVRLLRDLTADERAQFNIIDHDATCPTDVQGIPTVTSLTWTPVPTATIPDWTPLPLTPLPTEVLAATATA
jgi:hypothetical protein